MMPAAGQAPQIAYVMTHYPRVALSFIAGEIDGMDALGITIHPFAMNIPDAADLLSEDAKARNARTIYLKRSWGRLFGTFLATFLAHPISMTKLTFKAVGSARGDVPLAAKRMSHLLQASVVARTCRDRGISRLHAHFGQAPATIAWFACEILNFRRDAKARWSFTIHGFQDFVDETVARLDLKAKSAEFIACVSDFTRSQLCRLLHPSLWSRAQVVRCGIDLQQFQMRKAHAQASPPRIVSVGRISSEKGQIVLLQACKILAERGVDVRLTLIGSGPLERLIREEIARSAMERIVEMPGEQPPDIVRRELEQADIFCLPSFAEGLPISIMEAMAVGVPVIASAISGIPELVVNRETGFTVPPGNAAALADAIEAMLKDQPLRERMISAGRTRVEERHHSKATVERLHSLFHNALEREDG
jgi:colanic acid/amylovoran biosynthesis glycosyltransferase